MGGLGDHHAATLLGVLPGSQIANETLEDADAAWESVPSSGNQEAVQDPDTGEFLGLREHSPANVAQLRIMSEGMLALARKLEKAPGVGETTDPNLRDAYQRGERRPWRALVASLALAQRLDLPLFSDDRWIRRMAHSFGIRTFGTVALVEALDEKAVLASTQRSEIRQKLYISGAWGLKPSGQDLVATGRANSWLLDSDLRGALNDRAAWRSQPGQYWKSILDLLGAVYEERPASFRIWLRRAISAFNRAFPEARRATASQILLLLAWDIQDEPNVSRECFQNIVAEVRALPRSLRNEAPVWTAIAELMEFFAGQSEEVRFMLFMRAISRLKPEDAYLAFSHFVEAGPPLQPRSSSKRRRA